MPGREKRERENEFENYLAHIDSLSIGLQSRSSWSQTVWELEAGNSTQASHMVGVDVVNSDKLTASQYRQEQSWE